MERAVLTFNRRINVLSHCNARPLPYWRLRGISQLPRPLSRAFTAAQSSCTPKVDKEESPEHDPFHVRKHPWLERLGWDPESLKVGKDFNRWKIVPAATINHLCLGSIYAWSMFNQPMMRLNGVVAPSASDWVLGDISVTFSLVMGGFAWGAILGKYLDEFGPRVSCLLGASCLLSGFSLASVAVATQNLPLLYLGGAIWGVSNGWAYVPPISTLVKWFPDKKGIASGMCVLGYGGGAMIATPLFSKLIEHFRVIPEYLGPADQYEFANQNGRLFLETADGLKEVVVATLNDLNACGLAHITDAGVYVVGTGTTGVAETLAVLGVGYGLTMAATSFVFRLPPDHYTPPSAATAGSTTTTCSTKEGADNNESSMTPQVQLKVPDVPVHVATRSPQFWLLYFGFGSSIIGAYGLLSSGKLMMGEVFGSSGLPMVTAAFTSTYVAAMSGANLTGRVVFPTISDGLAHYRGGNPFYARKYTYTGMWGLSPFLYGGIIWSVHSCAQNPNLLSLGVFTMSSLGILSIFGGSTANRPAIIADIFGMRSMGIITARQLSVVLPSAFLGPQIVAYFRNESTKTAIQDLASKVDETAFHHAFGASKDALPSLVESKTVTISRLLEIMPSHLQVQDPTPFLYDNAMMVMGGFQLLALGCNLALRPPRETK